MTITKDKASFLAAQDAFNQQILDDEAASVKAGRQPGAGAFMSLMQNTLVGGVPMCDLYEKRVADGTYEPEPDPEPLADAE